MPRNINNLLIKTADEFLRLAQQGDDDDEPEEDLNAKVQRLTRELNQAVTQQKLQQGRTERSQPAGAQQPGAQPAGQQQPGAQPAGQQQPPQAQQQEQTPEQVVQAGLTNEVYASLKSVGSALRGVFTPEINSTINNVVYKNLFKTNLAGSIFGGKEDDIKKFVIQSKVRFDVRTVIQNDTRIICSLEVSDQGFKSKYQQFFGKAQQELDSYLPPIVYNIVQSSLRENNLEPKLNKTMVIDAWFSVTSDGKLNPIT